MDFINCIVKDPTLINRIINSSFFTNCKMGNDKDIYRIGKKSVQIDAKKKSLSNESFNPYSHLWLKIKPHYFFNDEVHNGNIMDIDNSINVLQEILKKLGVYNPSMLHVTSVEFGINSIPESYDTKEIVDNSLYFTKKKLNLVYSHLKFFKNTREKDGHPTIYCKTYHKGLQFPELINPNTWRYELGLSTNRKLKTALGINNFNDLLNPQVHKRMFEYLLNQWKYYLIIDDITSEFGCNNPEWWHDKRHFIGENGFRNSVIKYQKDNKRHKELFDLLKYTAYDLYGVGKIPTLIDSLNKPLISNKTVDEPQIKICLVTKLNIVMQKTSSIFLCNAGLYWYYEHQPEVFSSLCKQYLNRTRLYADLEAKIYFIAHNIRNSYFNGLRNRERFLNKYYHPNQLQFF